MKINILGTGDALATKCYNTCFVLEENNKYFLVDAGGGNGILVQLEKANISLKNIESMFITHTHTDHFLGAIWIIRMIGRLYLREDFNKPFYIYGNNEVIKAIIKVCEAVLPERFNNLLGKEIKLIEVDTGNEFEILGKKLEFFDIHAKKVKQTGFTIWLNKEDRFTFIGDEVCSKPTEKVVENSKWLMADAYMAGKEAEEYDPINKHSHSTVKFVAELSNRLNVKNLIMSHTVDKDLENRKRIFTEDAKKYFTGNIFVPDDLEIIELK